MCVASVTCGCNAPPALSSQPWHLQRLLSALQVPWNPVHNAQAIARIFRLGQTRPVFIYRLLYGGTAEEEIYNVRARAAVPPP
jgi:hypothetical protein